MPRYSKSKTRVSAGDGGACLSPQHSGEAIKSRSLDVASATTVRVRPHGLHETLSQSNKQNSGVLSGQFTNVYAIFSFVAF